MIIILSKIRRLQIDAPCVRRESYQGGQSATWKRVVVASVMIIQDIGEGKSFADDLNKERGTVSSRVALLLRSAEVKPLFRRFVQYEHFSPNGIEQ